MNDLSDLRSFGLELDRDLPGPSPRLRHRVLSAFAEPPGQPRPRRTRRTAIAGGLAVAAGLATAPWWASTPATDAQAAQILRRAASTARHQPALTVRPNQYVFIRQLMAYASIGGPESGPTVTTHHGLLETWMSASGTRRGLSRFQPRSSPLPGHPTGPWTTTAGSGDSTPAYIPRLPTSADAMLSYLRQHMAGSNPPDQQAFITAGDLIRDKYIPPAALAAVFDAVAKIPGVAVVPGAVTVNGTRGIAVQRIFQGDSYQLIFDPRTHAFIGERQIVVAGTHSLLKPGSLLYATTLLKVAIVDHAGQQPGS
jgi:hypothetical protein